MSKQEISRRTVLAGAAVASVATSLKHTVASTAANDDDAIDVGVITEPTASHRTGHLNVLAKCQGVRKVAVADHTGKSADDSRSRLGDRFDRFFDDPRSMLEAVRPALTVITMEGHRMPSAIEAAITADSHVLTEKPGCAKLEDFERVVRLAEKKERQVMLAMATRSGAAVKKARQLIADGLLGKPYSATMDWIADQTRLKSPAYHKSWLSSKDRAGGGKLIFHGVHYLDVIQFLIGDSIREVTGFCQNVGGQPIEVEDAAVVNFRFASGMIGTLNTGYYLNQGKQLNIRVWGSHGWLRLDFRAKTPLEWYSTHPKAPRGVQQFADTTGGYQPFFQEAIHAALEKTEWPITSSESLRALKVVFGAYRAAESGMTQTVS